MDSLLCDEVWFGSPMNPNHNHEPDDEFKSAAGSNYSSRGSTESFYTCKEDSRQAFSICLQKESSYWPESGYEGHLQSSGLVFSRCRAMHWLVKSQGRLNLSCQTIFNAANYFDRFFSMNQSKGWKYWMVELLAVACLSVATKFGEPAHPPLHEIQMEDLDHSFQSSLIQRMELTLLKALGWRLGSITAYSYLELLIWNIDSLYSFLLEELTTRVTELLLATLYDPKFLEFRPCVIAKSALRCVIEESLPSYKNADHLTSMTGLVPDEDHKDELIKCQKFLEKNLIYPFNQDSIAGRVRYLYRCPSSPVTVLTMDQAEIYDCEVEVSLSKIPGFEINLKPSKMKRKREDQ